MYEKKIYSFNIFGSCVSRDLFEHMKDETCMVNQYVARQSVISSVAEEIDIDERRVVLPSDFQRKMVIWDLKKSTFEIFKRSPGDFLIIDLIDERFSLLQKDRSYATVSNEVMQGVPDLVNKNQIMRKEYRNGKVYLNHVLIDGYVKVFCDKLKKIYCQEQIILHRALMVDKYVAKTGNVRNFEKNHLKNNKTINQILNYMYDVIIQNIPDIHIIDEMEEAIADEKHKWGLAPMHYHKEYYEGVIVRIRNIVSGSRKK